MTPCIPGRLVTRTFPRSVSTTAPLVTMLRRTKLGSAPLSTTLLIVTLEVLPLFGSLTLIWFAPRTLTVWELPLLR